MDSLYNVDLASSRPVRTQQPVCRPCTTASGYVVEINDEECMVISIVADHAYAGDARASFWKGYVRLRLQNKASLFTNVRIPVVRCDCLVDVLDVAAGRILLVEEAELVEHASWLICIDEYVWRCPWSAATLK